MPKKLDLRGQRFGRLTVIAETSQRDHSFVVWACKCDCGAAVLANVNVLRTGRTRSCGCLRRDVRTQNNITHGGAAGKRKDRLYAIWKMMRVRCANQNRDSSHRYVARGIAICPEWQNYAAFREWSLENGYAPDLTIDRIDNDQGYSPGNCRWTDRLTQANNTSRNVFVTINGERMTLAQAKRELGIPTQLYRCRRSRGWSEERALLPPLKTWSRHKK